MHVKVKAQIIKIVMHTEVKLIGKVTGMFSYSRESAARPQEGERHHNKTETLKMVVWLIKSYAYESRSNKLRK